MISYKNAKLYCCEDITTIENYEKAVMDPDVKWHLHHRREIDEGLSISELRDKHLYYKRPASELIFLTPSEHNRLHHKGKEPWNKGKKTGPHSGESNKKRSEALKGGNSTSWKKGNVPWNKGAKIDTKKYSNYGKHKTYHKAWNRKKVRCIETNEIFDSVEEAAKAKGLKGHSGITNVANGKALTAANLHWEYI